MFHACGNRSIDMNRECTMAAEVVCTQYYRDHQSRSGHGTAIIPPATSRNLNDSCGRPAAAAAESSSVGTPPRLKAGDAGTNDDEKPPPAPAAEPVDACRENASGGLARCPEYIPPPGMRCCDGCICNCMPGADADEDDAAHAYPDGPRPLDADINRSRPDGACSIDGALTLLMSAVEPRAGVRRLEADDKDKVVVDLEAGGKPRGSAISWPCALSSVNALAAPSDPLLLRLLSAIVPAIAPEAAEVDSRS